jgi:hypothetical protein
MWLVPSRRRVSKLRNFLNSAVDAQTSTPGLVIVDKKDYSDNEEAYAKMEKEYFPDGWEFYISEAVGMGPKIRESAATWGRGEWVGVLNDDHYVVTKEWDVRLISQLNGKNMITCNDHWNAPKRAAGATLFSMPLVEAMGFPLFPDQIDHLGIDDVWECIGRSTGCWEVDMSVIVEHHHAFKNPDMMDETHRQVYGTVPWQNPQTGELSPEAQKVQASFLDWFNNHAPAAVERVRALRKSEILRDLPPRKR